MYRHAFPILTTESHCAGAHWAGTMDGAAIAAFVLPGGSSMMWHDIQR